MRVSSAMGMVWALLALLCVCTAAEAASHTVGGGAQAQTFRQQGTALMSSQLAFAAHDIAGPDPWRSTPTTPRSHATDHVVRAHDAAGSGVRGLVASFAGGEPPAQHSECMSLGQLWSASHTTPPPPSGAGYAARRCARARGWPRVPHVNGSASASGFASDVALSLSKAR